MCPLERHPKGATVEGVAAPRHMGTVVPSMPFFKGRYTAVG